MLHTAIQTEPDPHTVDLKDSINGFADKTRLEAEPIKRILDRATREVVGWLYEWNTGSQVPMWKNGRKTDVIYE